MDMTSWIFQHQKTGSVLFVFGTNPIFRFWFFFLQSTWQRNLEKNQSLKGNRQRNYDAIAFSLVIQIVLDHSNESWFLLSNVSWKNTVLLCFSVYRHWRLWPRLEEVPRSLLQTVHPPAHLGGRWEGLQRAQWPSDQHHLQHGAGLPQRWARTESTLPLLSFNVWVLWHCV